MGAKGFGVGRIVRNLVIKMLRPASITAVLLAAAIVCVLTSILGFNISTAGAGILPLSRTTIQLSGLNPAAPVELPQQLAVDEETALEHEQQWKTVRMRVTAYCACRRCCGRHANGRTANNHRIRWGDTFVAADKALSFGTELLVPGYNQEKPVKVMDRGGAIKGNRLDVFFNSHKRAKKWGVRFLDVKVKKS